MIKYKKQFRLYDIYRYAATGVESKIKGIHSYEVNRDATVMTVRFGDYAHSKIYFASNEAELKDIVRRQTITYENIRRLLWHHTEIGSLYTSRRSAR